MASGSHDYGSWNLSEVIGSERSPTDVGAHQLPFGKSAMLLRVALTIRTLTLPPPDARAKRGYPSLDRDQADSLL
jgi:hypothetical protein